MRSIARLVPVLAMVSLLSVACGTGATASPGATDVPTQAATDTPAPTAAPTVSAIATATPIPMTDGEGPEYVVGTSSLTVTKNGTETVDGDVTRLRGQEMTSYGPMNDARLNGTGLVTMDADIHGSVASEWGTTRIENAGGAWEGAWTGASWNDGVATSVSGWLIGSGAYEGYTYYFHVYGPSMPFKAEGIIFPGSPPTP